MNLFHSLPFTSQANFQGTSRGRAPSDQQSNCQEINNLMAHVQIWGKGQLKSFLDQLFGHILETELFVSSSLPQMWP